MADYTENINESLTTGESGQYNIIGNIQEALTAQESQPNASIIANLTDGVYNLEFFDDTGSNHANISDTIIMSDQMFSRPPNSILEQISLGESVTHAVTLNIRLKAKLKIYKYTAELRF